MTSSTLELTIKNCSVVLNSRNYVILASTNKRLSNKYGILTLNLKLINM